MAEEDFSQQRFVDYFVVCGLGVEVCALKPSGGRRGKKQLGFRGMKERYEATTLDRFPRTDYKEFQVPPGFEMFVLPGGLEMYDRGPHQGEESTQPRSYPIVLTDGDGSKIYVWVVAFRDPVDEDIASTYSLPPNTYVDKCICLVSHWPFFHTFREVLEEIHRMCFSPSGCSRPVWDTVAHIVTSIPVPVSGNTQVLFTVENSLLSLSCGPPATKNLPYTQVSFEPLVRCLDVDNILKLFTAVALEKRIVLHGSKYELLTTVAESMCQIIYPFHWVLTYVPVLPVKLLDMVEKPGSFLCGVCTATSEDAAMLYNLEGPMIVDLDNNRVHLAQRYEDPHGLSPGYGDGGALGIGEEEDLPALPQPEAGELRKSLLALIQPSMQRLDRTRTLQGTEFDYKAYKYAQPWSEFHDREFRLMFVRFFASLLHGYRNFLDYPKASKEEGGMVGEGAGADGSSGGNQNSNVTAAATTPSGAGSGAGRHSGPMHVVFNAQAFVKRQRLRGLQQQQSGVGGDGSTGRKLRRFKTTTAEEGQQDSTDLTFVVRLFGTQSWVYFLEKGISVELGLGSGVGSGSPVSHPLSLFDAACEAAGRGRSFQLPLPTTLPLHILTVAEPIKAQNEQEKQQQQQQQARCTYDRFPAMAVRSEEEQQSRNATLRAVEESLRAPNDSARLAASGADTEDMLRRSFIERGLQSRKAQELENERNALVVDIKFKLFSLWEKFLRNSLEEESLEFETIYAMLESDAEGIAGPCFLDCILVRMAEGWDCQLSQPHFAMVTRLLLTVIARASHGSQSQDHQSLLLLLPPGGSSASATVLSALQVSTKLHFVDEAGMKDYMQRHIGHLSVWHTTRFWDFYFAVLMEQFALHEAKHADVVLEQLLVLAHHMAELRLSDGSAWALLESLANREHMSVGKQIRLRGQLARMQARLESYYGGGTHVARHHHEGSSGHGRDRGGGMAGSNANDGSSSDANNNGGGNSGNGSGFMGGTLGRNWMSNWMSGKDSSSTASNSTGKAGGAHMRKSPSWGGSEYMEGIEFGGSMRGRPGVTGGGGGLGHGRGGGLRVLRGHTGPITCLHVGTRNELGDLLGDDDDAGYFVSGSADKTVKLWDPNLRGTELRASMSGHLAAIRCLTSDRTRVVSGGDDGRVLVWDKGSSRQLIELTGHGEAAVSCVRMLAGIGRGSVITAGHDGRVMMSDTRSDRSATCLVSWPSPVLCLDYLDHAYMLAAAAMDGVCRVWDVRAGKERYALKGHSGWVRCVAMFGDAVLTGSDDWTARVWTLNDGLCESVLACHAGPVTCVDFSNNSHGIVTGSADCTVRLWDRSEGSVRCVETVGAEVHNAAIVKVKAGDKYLAVAAANNTLSLFHRHSSQGWQGGRGLGGGAGEHQIPENAPSPDPPQGMADWRLRRSMNKAPDMIRQVACDVDHGRICTGSRSGLLRVWDPPPPQ